jgi:replicative superfamily II helicase
LLGLPKQLNIYVIGLPKQYRKAVERLFRMKRLSVVIATESLSMGINMPTKTSIFAGDNVFLNPMVFRQVNKRPKPTPKP